MNDKKYWELLFQHHKYPSLIAEKESEKVIYYNEEMESLLDQHENIIGQNFYDVITNDSSVLGNNPQLNWEYKEIHEGKIFNKHLNQVFSTSYTLIEYKGKFFNFCRFRPVQTTKHFHYTFEEMMSRCITISQEDQESKTPTLLEILGEFYDAEKTFLYEIDYHTEKVPCIYSWKKHEKIEVISDISSKLELKNILDWLQSRNEIGMLEAAKYYGNYAENSQETDILDILSLENVVVSVIEDSNNQPLAAVVVSNRNNMSADFRLLQAVTRFIETDISKTTMKNTLNQIGTIDMLTGFQNRSSYAEKIVQLQKNPSKTLGIAFANVNGLKKVNADYGIAKGDSYIKKAAECIKNHFTTDFYRISGDEFICFIPNMEKDHFEQLIISIQEKMTTDGNSTFALGHAWGTGRYDLNTLIKEADNVMYINKQEFYHTSYQNFNLGDDSILGNLLTYLKNDEFLIFLQPQVFLSNSSLYGAEALIRRFDKANQKMVFPDQFIPLYEQNSVIRHIDIFVVEKVCQLLQSWRNTQKEIPISVNLSRVTLQEYGIVKTISKICDHYQVPRELLVIEVTERVGLVENNVASSLIHDFKEQGFKISLDDFGCAYSNIVTLAQIQIDEVKIDKSLVDFITTNEKNKILVKNVLSMCNELENTSTLAEGIETKQQADLLYKLNCHLGQGFYFSRPIPVEEFAEKYIFTS